MRYIEFMLTVQCSVLLGGCSTLPAQSPEHESATFEVRHHPRRASRRAEPARPASRPVTLSLPPNASCSQARNAYSEGWKIAGGYGPADLTAGELSGVLSRGAYLDDCEVPETIEVGICAAVQSGRALGVTVTTSPRAPQLERCIDRQIRALTFPAHPRMDLTETRFAANSATDP
jgi:hypothetical protein